MTDGDIALAGLLFLPIVIGLLNRQYGLTWVVCASLFGVIALSKEQPIETTDFYAVAMLGLAGLYVIAGAAAAMLKPLK